MKNDDYQPINSYGVIGDLHTVALIDHFGSIDWCCLPIFDSPSSFAKILDSNKGGNFKISLPKSEHHQLSYITDTNILSNTMMSNKGGIELVDYMPIVNTDGTREFPNTAHICRHIECIKGINLEVFIEFDPKPGYGQSVTLSPSSKSNTVQEYPLSITSSHPIHWDDTGRKGRIVLSHGDSARIVLSYGENIPSSNIVSWTDMQVYNTRQYWERWLNQCLYKGRWRRVIERSALTLKLLAFKPTGAILAAPTTSLPEGIGGSRNWDYRFSWLRDSALILGALLPLGFVHEATEYVNWIISKMPNANDPMPILYSITDKDTTEELELPQFEGYMKSSPVRIGNAAKDQVQLDVYGEVIDSLYLYTIYGNKPDDAMWQYITVLAERICIEWQYKDEGIWEVRGEKSHFTYSKLMCWVGLDRAIKIGEEHGYLANYAQWKKECKLIHAFILSECVDTEKQYLMQSPDNCVADASNLLAPILGFLPPKDPIMINTVDQTIEQLSDNQMIYRYLNDDGIEGHEGTFNICTFWLIEALALQGRVEQAHEILNNMLELASDLGLYAEETDAQKKQALGNFPQAFSHLGLINAAAILNVKLSTQSNVE